MARIQIAGFDGTLAEKPLGRQNLTIGRSRDCSVVLADSTASRTHAEISRSADGYSLRDLGSFNGTLLNGAPVQQAVLHDGDVIEIGQTRITFYARASQRDSLADSLSLGRDTGIDLQPRQIVGSSPQAPPAESVNLLLTPEAAVAGSAAHGPERAALSSLERANKVLFVLYEISRQLSTVQDFTGVLRKIMDLIFMVIDADSGFLVLRDEHDSKALTPVVVKYRDEYVRQAGQLSASRTIMEQVMREKVALLTTNAMDDSRLDHAKSVFLQQIRSAMCVPLWKKDTIIGVIQLDSIRLDNLFTQDDLELLTAIGSQMAMVIEQASLNEQIREEENMRRRLERFHSPQVVEMILHGGQETKDHILEAREITATILFTDIIGFTALSERLPPREITLLLNQYFSRMTDIVFEHDGTLDKYIGDGLMAVFGAPLQKPDDAARAIRAALSMRHELSLLQDRLPADHVIDIRIGINTGRVVAGNIGSPRRLEYTVIGDPVNIASRLESLAAPNQILIGEETRRLVGDAFDIHAIGPRRIKGKRAEVPVYEVR